MVKQVVISLDGLTKRITVDETTDARLELSTHFENLITKWKRAIKKTLHICPKITSVFYQDTKPKQGYRNIITALGLVVN